MNDKWFTRCARFHSFIVGASFLIPFTIVFTALAQKPEEIPPLAPVYPEIPATFWEQHGVLVVVGSILVLAVLGLLAWWLSQPKPVKPEAPEVLARRTLDVLRKRNEDGAVLSEVSQVLRRYLIGAFGLPGNEMTTTEFCLALERNEKFNAETRNPVVDFLRRCDDRKFALGTAGEMNAATRALELVALGEARRAQLAAAQSKAGA